MDYFKLCDVYEKLEFTAKGLEKASILAKFLDEIKGEFKYIYLLQGRIFPDYDNRELGMSIQLVIKAIAKASGFSESGVLNEFKERGDLGEVAYELVGKRKQQTSLFSSKLSVEKVFESLLKITTLEGKGTVGTKISLIVDLLHSAVGVETKYIVRTVLADLKIGIGSGLIRDSIVEYCFHPDDMDKKREFASKVQSAYNLATDWAIVFERACENRLDDIKLSPKKPVKVMLYPKVRSAEEALKVVGSPAAFEYKYDGFRMMINKDEDGNVKLFTRRLEDVSIQFPEVVEYVKTHIKGKSFIVDSEAIGYDKKTKKYTEFQAISQRIRRKYDIERLVDELPVELRVFDIIYYEGENMIEKTYEYRREFLSKLIIEEKLKIGLAERIVTDSIDEAHDFFNRALADNQEGLMVKGLDKQYKPGARVGYGVKWKPVDSDFDLVITGAEWGNGKRAGWLTSFDIACRNGNGELLEIGRVGSGVKELEQEEGGDVSYSELTEMLKVLIISEEGKHVSVKPEIVVTIQFQNVQKSPSYSSGYALRFPRITCLRPDRNVEDITTVEEVEEEI